MDLVTCYLDLGWQLFQPTMEKLKSLQLTTSEPIFFCFIFILLPRDKISISNTLFIG